METYTLWHANYDEESATVRFFATAVNVQLIRDGTEEMMKRFLDALGAGDAAVEDWTLAHFVTDYLTDDREGAVWEDVWMHTWEAQVRVSKPASVIRSSTGLAESDAWDETWDGKEISPSTCVVVADFPGEPPLEDLREALAKAGVTAQIKTCWEPGQAHIEIACDPTTLAAGASEAASARAVCEALGATTHWRYRAERGS